MLLTAITIISSCKNSNTSDEYVFKSRNFRQKIKIFKADSLRFELDSLTAPVVYSMQEVNDGPNRYLAYLNDETSTIYFNDFSTRKISKIIHIQGDSIANKKAYQGMLYHNKDSIFLFSYKPRIVMINDQGLVVKRFDLSKRKAPNNKLFFKGFYVSTALPAFYSNNRLFINSLVVGDIKAGETRKIQMIIDLKSGKDRIGEASIPKVYEGKNFGSLHYEIFGMSYNPITMQAVFSFPAAKQIIVTDLNSDKIKNVSAESQYIDHFITYDASRYEDAKSEPVGEYFMTTPTYGSIFYDKYKNIYYRMALLPVEQKNVNYEEKNPPTKRISLIVFDEHFNYLGEQLLDKNKYWSSNAFVSKEGLNIQNRTKSDETLNFTTFNFRTN